MAQVQSFGSITLALLRTRAWVGACAMEQVDEGGEATMNVDAGIQGGQEETQSLTARVDTMSEMFAKIMGELSSTNKNAESIMMSLGPQGPQALQMGAIKEQMKQSDEKNEVRFKKLEETLYQNKTREVRFEWTANKVGGFNKRLKVSETEETEGVGDTDKGGASKAGSSNDGGGSWKIWGRFQELGGWT